jgi:putative phage-type endonuclease
MSALIQGTPEWVKMRSTMIGASDAAAILGVSKWVTPFQLWEQKLGLREVEVNSSMLRGTAMEEEARKEFENLHGINVFPEVVFSKEYPWMMASLDGISLDLKTVVEIKCVNKRDHQTALNGVVPEHYFPQCQHQLAVTELPFMYYFSYDAMNPATVIVPRDDVYIASMVQKEKEFYRCMMEFDPPPLCDRDYILISEEEDILFKLDAFNYLHYTSIEKDAADRAESFRKSLIERAEGRNIIGCGVKMTRYHRKGNVQYAKVPELLGVDLEPYRKPPIETWRIGESDG